MLSLGARWHYVLECNIHDRDLLRYANWAQIPNMSLIGAFNLKLNGNQSVQIFFFSKVTFFSLDPCVSFGHWRTLEIGTGLSCSTFHLQWFDWFFIEGKTTFTIVYFDDWGWLLFFNSVNSLNLCHIIFVYRRSLSCNSSALWKYFFV